MTKANETREPKLGLDRLLGLAHRQASAPVDDAVHAAGRTRLVAAASDVRAPESKRRMVGALAVAAVIALGVGLWLRARPLRYEVDDASRFGSNYVSAPDDDSAKISFSDGSKVMADPGTRLRIDETTSTGARILIERGSASATVVHRARSGWLFMAGPFEVHVTGTRFTLGWDPQKGAVDLTLEEGSVEVKSPIGESRFAVHAGQRFRASLLDGSTKVEAVSSKSGGPGAVPGAAKTPATAAAPIDSPRAGGPVAAPATIANVGAPSAPANANRAAVESEMQAQPAQTGRESWPERVRRGDFASVVLAATNAGVASCFASCSAQDLRALGDAARYTSQPDLARQSLLALRKRFTGTQRNAAAFLLGRTSESSKQLGPAAEWYRTYLQEAPNGEFAADALAGRIRTTAARDGQASAKPLAEEYLRRFPAGAYAQAARALAGSD